MGKRVGLVADGAERRHVEDWLPPVLCAYQASYCFPSDPGDREDSCARAGPTEDQARTGDGEADCSGKEPAA